MPSQKRARQRELREQARQARLAAQRRRAITRRVIVIAIVLGLIAVPFIISGRDEGTDVTTGDDPTTTTVAEGEAIIREIPAEIDEDCPKADGSSPKRTTFEEPLTSCLERDVDYSAVIRTDVGDIEVDLFEDQAPKTVSSFVALARYDAYEGIPFHRVIPDFVIQGGDVSNKDGTGDAGYRFEDELPRPEQYREGSLAMANSGPDTNGSQFFIVTSALGADTLVKAAMNQAKYSLFGQVTSGMDVVRAIEQDGDQSGKPKVVHTILGVEIREAKKTSPGVAPSGSEEEGTTSTTGPEQTSTTGAEPATTTSAP